MLSVIKPKLAKAVSTDASAVRNALNTVSTGGTVKVAGYCAGAITQNSTSQVALISKTVTLSGGYTTSNWSTYNPISNPTTLDALGALGVRVLDLPHADHAVVPRVEGVRDGRRRADAVDHDRDVGRRVLARLERHVQRAGH